MYGRYLKKIIFPYCNKKLSVIVTLFILLLYLILVFYKKEEDKIIKENFFIIDSNHLEKVVSHMYGYSVSLNGILTDNYYKQIGEYQEPEHQGVFIMIRKFENEIIIHQDFYGCFGLYFYENKEDNYFALSNSFLLLEEYLIGKQNITFNKDFADNLITTDLCSCSLDETLINEIKQIPSDSFVVINIKKKLVKINKIDYKENTIPLDSEEGLKIIDKWVDKWGYILRSLKKQTGNIASDLSGGIDTRVVLSILLNSGINMNDIIINSINNKLNDHDIDYIIASKISKKFGFELNKPSFDNKSISLNIKTSILNTLYTKLGFHKQFYLKEKFYIKPRFIFTGGGGESLRGKPGIPIEKYIKLQSFRQIEGHSEELFNSSKNLMNRSISLLKKQKSFNNEYEISYDLYSKNFGKYHYGKEALEGFLSNNYNINPLMDPDIKQIKYDIKGEKSHDLIAYIFVRLAKDLINFEIQGNRTLDRKSIEKAKKLNEKRFPYVIKTGFNKNFFIDRIRKYSSFPFKINGNPYDYLHKLIKSSKYIELLNKIYDINIYNWANQYSKKTNYHSLSQHYALLAVANTIDYLSLNEKGIKKDLHKIFYINI